MNRNRLLNVLVLRCLQRGGPVLSILALLLSTVVPTFAQAPARPDRGIVPLGTYAISDIENINLSNGNVNLSIPLASLPPIAGGKLSWTVRAVYNSKLWDVTKEEVDNPIPSIPPPANY
ncbi:MAG: hypothetical protein LAO21_18440 [Acidobacteriia bacterium]|nr:hypothetical protein [Terriglobia bacterium]